MSETRRARPWTALLAAALLLPACSDATPPAAGPAPPVTWASGVYTGARAVADVARFGTWRGAAPTHVVDFVDHSTWASIADPSWLARGWAGTPYAVSYSVPLLPARTGTVAQGAAGAYDHHFAAMARRLVAAGQGRAILRIGWEMNGRWYRWSAVDDPARWVAFYRRVVAAIRAVPGQGFRFEWSPNLGYGAWRFDVESAYPGDDVVDIVGVSAYDQSWSRGPDEDAARWKDMRSMPFGWDWLASFAARHRKPIAVAEWGLSQRPDGHGGGDNPHYVERMHAWFAAHRVLYETYFDHDEAPVAHHAISTGRFPRAAARYRELWRRGSSPEAGAPTHLR